MQSTPRLMIVAALLAGAAVHAADKPKEAAFGKGKGAGAYLTLEQLRGCLKQQSRAGQNDAELVKEQATLADTQAEIARLATVLKEQLPALDRSNAEAVAAYNAQAAARDKLIDAYEASVTQFNTRVEAAKADREAFAKACDNRRYFEEDETAIKKGR
jgi:hypothetical protein